MLDNIIETQSNIGISVETASSLEDSTWIDVRCTREFLKGHYPRAIHIPIFSDIEYEKLGTIYRRKGQREAIDLGKTYVNRSKARIRNQILNVKSKNIIIYCARGGMESNIFMPRDTPIANIKEVSIIGSNLTLIDGLINDAGKLSQEKAEKENLFDVSTLKEPYRVEGKKTMGYEIAEQMNWELPDAIIYPTGGGTGIVGMWKAFDELEQLGWIDSKRPKMFCVQSSGCAPIVKSFVEKTEFAEPWQNAKTIASGLRVPVAIGDYLILDALRSSNGGAVSVDDEDILLETKLIAELEGMFICPEGGATIKGLKILLDNGQLSTDDNILLLNTGTGLKYLDIFKN